MLGNIDTVPSTLRQSNVRASSRSPCRSGLYTGFHISSKLPKSEERKTIAIYAELLVKGVKPPQLTCFKCKKVVQDLEVDGCARGRHHFVTQTCGEHANTDVATCICGLMFCEADSWDEHVLACKMRIYCKAGTRKAVINKMDEAS